MVICAAAGAIGQAVEGQLDAIVKPDVRAVPP
jgi:hypothetical protein